MDAVPLEFTENVLQTARNPLFCNHFARFGGIFEVVARQRSAGDLNASVELGLAEDGSILYRTQFVEKTTNADGSQAKRIFQSTNDVALGVAHFNWFKIVVDKLDGANYRKVDGAFEQVLHRRHLFPMQIFEDNRNKVPRGCPIFALFRAKQIAVNANVWMFGATVGDDGHFFVFDHLLKNRLCTLILPLDFATNLDENNRFLLTLAFESPPLRSIRFQCDDSKSKYRTHLLCNLFQIFCKSKIAKNHAKSIVFDPRIKVDLEELDRNFKAYHTKEKDAYDIYIFEKELQRCVKWTNNYDTQVVGIANFVFHAYS